MSPSPADARLTPRVLGIDPGLNTTGYGVLQVAVGGPKLCEAGVVRGMTRGSLTAVAIEQLYSHYDRPRTAILMGHARGVIILAAAQAGIPVTSYAATQVKKTLTGHGRASKLQIQTAIQRELRLATAPEPFDISDALAIALCHYYSQREWAALARQTPRRAKQP